MFIARGVCAGALAEIREGEPMPELHGEAYELYVKAHGPERYLRYAEKDNSTCHGSAPPTKRSHASAVFTHRPEHDVESVAWTMLFILLRIRPETFEDEKKWAPIHVATIWQALHEHAIPDKPYDVSDNRDRVFKIKPSSWPEYFPPEMADVGIMLGRIMEQVEPEYAYCMTQPPEDHLHEAVQRLILQYLVDHRDKDIKLDPDNLRPTKAAPPQERFKTVTSVVSKAQAQKGTGSQTQPKHASRSKGDSSCGSKATPPIVAGTSSRSRRTGERASGSSTPIVMNQKRKSEGQGSRRSKRLKAMSGLAIDEEDEEDHEE